ncbi:hypothetical protein KSS87_012015 [Heliosperma pusillum]|nr:hypothetical protein KSS87_012015 [Heliosperma pusillum]
MQLIIVTYANYFFIDVHPQETILEIKQKISNILAIPVTSQTLDLLGLELIDGLDLGDYPMIVEGTNIDLFVDSTYYDMPPMELEHDHDSKILVTIKFSSRQINIEVDVTETVQSLKEKIHILDGTPTKRMSLYISGLEMDEEFRYLAEYGVQEFSEISVSLKSMNRVKVEPSTRKLSMVIQTSTSLLNASIPLEMKDSCSVNEVRQLLLSRKILPVDDYIFIHKQRIMRDTSSLRWHGVENGDYLYVFRGTVTKDGLPVDHAARVMRVITWNKALSSMSEGGKDEYEDNETLATVLDKLMAWEKKLYEEVKAGELMKLEYQRKVGLLNKQKKRGASAESVEKTKAAVSHLHTRYIVDMQSMDSTVAEVNELRDQQLYPKLVELVDGMAKMWENICLHHDTQLQITTELKSLDIMLAPRETTRPHHQCTVQLSNVIQQWLEQFENMVNQQKQYVRCLHNWLKLNLIPLESSLKEKVSSPPRSKNPPIQYLLHAWHDSLEKLPDEVTRTAISSFGAVIKTILLQQEEEMKLKQTCEEMRKEYLRKNQAFEDWYHKYIQRKGPEAMDPDPGEDGTGKDPITERRFVVSSLKKKLEEETEKHQRQCVQVREKSLGTLKTRLPELFRALSEYAHASCDSYNKLRAIVLSQSSNGVSS